MVYFDGLVWDNIISFVGDLKMEKQREYHKAVVEEINSIGYDYLELVQDNSRYYFEWSNFYYMNYISDGVESDSDNGYYNGYYTN